MEKCLRTVKKSTCEKFSSIKICDFLISHSAPQKQTILLNPPQLPQ